MNDILKKYVPLVEFLGIVLGKHCEIVLQDCAEKQCIVSIANGEVSGRKEGAPLTDFALRIMSEGEWNDKDYKCLYNGTTSDSRKLQSSTYFIKDNDKLIGMLCINVDVTKYKELSDAILKLGGLMPDTFEFNLESNVAYEETFSEDLSDVIRNNIMQILDDTSIPPDRLRQEEKIDLVRQLNSRGIFQLKGAVSAAAEEFSCSEATMYRYLSKINKNK